MMDKTNVKKKRISLQRKHVKTQHINYQYEDTISHTSSI